MSRSLRNLILGLGIAFAAVTLAQAAGGILDPTFSTDGKVTTDFGARGDFGYSMALQTDGKTIIAGGSTDYSPCCTHDFALARYNSDGSLDLGFSGDGKVITGVRDSSGANAVVLQPDGKIIAIGGSTAFGGNSGFALVRYNSNGSLDMGFDSDGKVITVIGNSSGAMAGVLQPDGKILVAGSSTNGSHYDFALARYNSNGSLDTTFDTDGKVTTDFAGFDDRLLAIAIQPDGRIVAAGWRLISDDYDFALARYNSNGSLDTTFDTDGKVTTDFGFNDSANAIAIQPDGRIVAAGSSDYNDNFDFALARYNSDGSLDTTFDTDGKVSPDLGSIVSDGAVAVAIQQDGKIVVAGRSGDSADFSADFAVMRYDSNGSPDITFDMDGKVTTAIGSGEDYGYAIALGPDGKIVVAGSSFTDNDYDFALARYIGDELFSDVPIDHWAWSFIERLYSAGITGGCSISPLQYCPDVTVTRSQMAVFLLRGIHDSSYSPPAVGSSTGFGDVPVDYWSASWIKQLAAEGITGGCGSGNYCPEYPVTRDQMAVFLLRSKYGPSYSPPAVGGSTGFGDVPVDHWAAPWIKQLVTEGITAGCGSGNYCPGLPVTRAQMAVFLVRTFNLP